MKSPTHTIYFHHDFQSLTVESMAHSVYPVYPDHVPRIQNQSKVNPHATPPKPQLTFKALGNVVKPLFLIILLRLHPPMKRLAPHRAQAVLWLPRSSLFPPLHHPALISHFWPILRVTPCTRLFLQLKPFDPAGKAACITPHSIIS